MTPGWERSKGAILEHRVAKRNRLEIHYYNNIIQLGPQMPRI
ncbi:MAG: DUF4406 domain-containing protein [Patescibacteria group bacterium]|nr:DUF4406 domain-containing protein [Patescibacteria group bacterium]